MPGEVVVAGDAEGLGELSLDKGRGAEHEAREHGLDLGLLSIREGLGAGVEVCL